MKVKDVNGKEIKEGNDVTYLVFTPNETKEFGSVYTHERHGGLWVNGIPLDLIEVQSDKRKLTLVDD